MTGVQTCALPICRCCSKNKGRGHRSRCRAGLGSPEPRPTPASSGAAYGNAFSSVLLAACACAPLARQGRPEPFGGRHRRGPPGSRVGGRQRPEEALPARCGSQAPEASRCPGGYRAALEAEPLVREGGGTRPSGGLLYQSTGLGGRVSDFPTPLSTNESPAPGRGSDRGVGWRPDPISGSEESRDPGAPRHPPPSEGWRLGDRKSVV